MSREINDGRPPCPRCGSGRINKSGVVMGKQRYLCRDCYYQFTSPRIKGKPGDMKAMALLLYSYGLSQVDIGRLLNVSAVSVHTWIKDLTPSGFIRPEDANLITIPLDDLLKILPVKHEEEGRPVILVPVTEAGEVAGIINISAVNSSRPEMT